MSIEDRIERSRAKTLRREGEMGRPREFNEAEALKAAVECIWQHGYETTSIRDLADKMAISTPSLYTAYGGKRYCLPGRLIAISIAQRGR
jgi:AcrR family transcriptional regulator